MIQESVTIAQVVELLNNAVATDPQGMKSLVEKRVRCNKELGDHPTIQVSLRERPALARGGSPTKVYEVGFLGMLNGIFGIDDDGWGAIVARFTVDCPSGHEWPEKLQVGDECPTCGEVLVLGRLLEFFDNGRRR